MSTVKTTKNHKAHKLPNYHTVFLCVFCVEVLCHLVQGYLKDSPMFRIKTMVNNFWHS